LPRRRSSVRHCGITRQAFQCQTWWNYKADGPVSDMVELPGRQSSVRHGGIVRQTVQCQTAGLTR
ncbi:hypothetical protein scyTo_0024906, partial [Scyliorhinus torazame]|nr:hypothetical protein [Scyliorhinus torazame]